MAKKPKKQQSVSQILRLRFVPGSNGTAWTQKDGKKDASKKACRKSTRQYRNYE